MAETSDYPPWQNAPKLAHENAQNLLSGRRMAFAFCDISLGENILRLAGQASRSSLARWYAVDSPGRITSSGSHTTFNKRFHLRTDLVAETRRLSSVTIFSFATRRCCECSVCFCKSNPKNHVVHVRHRRSNFRSVG